MDNNSPNQPIRNKEEVAKNPDPKIDQDFNNFPHAPSSEELIDPKTETEKDTAQVNDLDESQSDGSANAFEGSEGLDTYQNEGKVVPKDKKNDTHY